MQDELRHVREQINNAVEGRSIEKLDLKNIEKAIERTELGIKVLFAMDKYARLYFYMFL